MMYAGTLLWMVGWALFFWVCFFGFTLAIARVVNSALKYLNKGQATGEVDPDDTLNSMGFQGEPRDKVSYIWGNYISASFMLLAVIVQWLFWAGFVRLSSDL